MRRLLAGTCLSTSFVILAAGLAAPACAAEASPQVAEVIVTANKRAENLQTVPAAIQAVGGDQVRAASVVEFTDLTKIAPSLVVRPAEQPVNSSVSIRGIGTFAFSIGVEPDVAVIIDDVPVGFEARAFANLNDIERIEVLRGPQSTLYGKSASAGLINIVTPAPSTSGVTGRFDLMATTDAEYQASGAVSAPLTDTLGFRLSANYDNFRGNVKNLFTGEHVNGRELGTVNGKLQWRPTAKFEATLGASIMSGDTTIGRPFIALSPNANLRGNPALPPSVWAPGVTASSDNDEVSNNFTSGNRFTDYTQYLKLSYDLDWATLLSITSHDDYFLKDRLDVDEGSSPVIDNRQPNGKFTYGQWTQEFRLVSPSDRPLRYTGGLYYADDEYTRRFSRGPFFSIANWYATSDSKQTAAFGQVDWDLRPDTTLTAGARYQHEKIDYTFLDHANGDAFFSGSGSESFGTYKVALDHHLTEDIMVYASWATGHKGQTFDLSTGFNLNRALAGPVRPETSNSYEVGARTSLLDHRLTFNITFFDAYYRNFQAQGIEVLPDGTTNFRLANVGRINNKGVEIDSTAAVGDWTFGFDGTYLDAEITDFPKAQCFPLQTAAQGCAGSPASQNLKGGTPPQSPKFKFAIPFSYQHPLGSSPFVGVFQGIYSYSSKFNFSLSQDPRTIQSAYGILNLSVGVRNPNDHYEIMAFVNNVTDEHYYANMFNSTTTYSSQTATQVLPPRDYRRYAGVRFAYTF